MAFEFTSGTAGMVPWKNGFHVMLKPIGARCNLNCSYCFYLEKERVMYPSVGVPRMSEATVEKFVQEQMMSQPGESVLFNWQGGEPTLMGLDFFKKVVEIQKRYAAGRIIENTLQTNGTLLNDEWARFFRLENFLIGISLDGPKEMHDAFRVDRGGYPTWDKVMEGIRLLKRHRVRFNTLTVVHKKNVGYARDIYAFLKKNGSGFMQFIPLVERRTNESETNAGWAHALPIQVGTQEGLVYPKDLKTALSPECPTAEAFGGFLCAIFDIWSRRDIGKIFVQTFDSTLANWVGEPGGTCVFQERCGRALALEHNGDFYMCDHYVYPEYRLGNIHKDSLGDMGNSTAARRFGDAKANLPKTCLDCEVRMACNGDCPKHRFVYAGEGQPGISYLCAAYKRFFKHVAPTMDAMARLLAMGRAPAEVMKGVKG